MVGVGVGILGLVRRSNIRVLFVHVSQKFRIDAHQKIDHPNNSTKRVGASGACFGRVWKYSIHTRLCNKSLGHRRRRQNQ